MTDRFDGPHTIGAIALIMGGTLLGAALGDGQGAVVGLFVGFGATWVVWELLLDDD